MTVASLSLSLEERSGGIAPCNCRYHQMPIMQVDLMLPLGGPFSPDEPERIAQALTVGYDTLWMQEWPQGSGVPGHIDHGTGYDPLLYALHLSRTYESALSHVGFAVLRIDYRAAAVTARAIVTVAGLGGRPLLLGLGAKNDTDEKRQATATAWRTIRSFLYQGTSSDTFALPPGFTPPRMYQVSSHPLLWEAIDYEAEGWLTNLLIPRQIEERASVLRQHAPRLEVALQIFCYLDLHNDQRLEMGERKPLHIGRTRLRELAAHWQSVGVTRLIYVPAQTPTVGQLQAFVEIAGGVQ